MTLVWHKSSYSHDNGNCVELATLPDGRVAARDSKTPTTAPLLLTPTTAAAWLAAVRSGKFD